MLSIQLYIVCTVTNTRGIGPLHRYSCSLDNCRSRLLLLLITVSCPAKLSADDDNDDDNDEVLFRNKLAVIYMNCFR